MSKSKWSESVFNKDSCYKYIEPFICSEIDIIEICDGDIAHRYEPKNVIFNGPATIVFWNDGTKTVVKCEGEAFNKEKGLAMAIAKKVLGNKGRYFNVFKKWCVEDDDEELRNY